MNLSARLSALIEIMDQARTTSRPTDGILSGFLRTRRYIGSRDRRWLSNSTYDIWRNWARLNWHLDRHVQEPTTRRLLLAWMLLVDQRPADEVRSYFDGKAKYSPKPLKPAEQGLIDALAGQPLEHEDMPEGVKRECPDWALPLLTDAFGPDADVPAEFAALTGEAPFDLRVNTLRATRDEVLTALGHEGIPAEATPFSPTGIRVGRRASLTHLPIFRDGKIEIQDEGSQLIGHAVATAPGLSVVDFCAGAGGKSLLLAAQMNNKGRIVACDVSKGRLSRSRDRLKRAGVDNVSTHVLSTEHDKWVKRNQGKFDRVLLDVPCLGTGTWRRNPDMRWRKSMPDLQEIVPLQTSILDSAARLVKPGGRLIYGTCSLLPPENDGQVDAFLERDDRFTKLDIREIFRAQIGDEAAEALALTGETMQLTPARHGTDGFYCAVMERKSD
ncbi:MAG: RsmB/NOP family class I SAM-dependent RNA methyltransferase [Alphaproteobacteria bacterium]